MPRAFRCFSIRFRSILLTVCLAFGVTVTCVTFCVAFCTNARATSIIPLSIEQLAAQSSLVVQARAGRSHCAWDSEHRLIHTYTEFDTITAIQGSPAAHFTVSQPGGSVEGLTLKVSGVRSWTRGQESVLFLKPSASGDRTLVITGLMQGNFAVSHDVAGRVVVSNGIAHAAVARASHGNPSSANRPVYPAASTITLDELKQRVARASK